jgi:hypothetical protein
MAFGGLIRQGFSVGREGSHGIKNNASKATINCEYLTDIITLFRFMNLTTPLFYAYAIQYVDPGADAEHPDGTTLLAHGRAR